MKVENRLDRLERENRKLRGWLLMISVVCALPLILAAGRNLVVHGKISATRFEVVGNPSRDLFDVISEARGKDFTRRIQQRLKTLQPIIVQKLHTERMQDDKGKFRVESVAFRPSIRSNSRQQVIAGIGGRAGKVVLWEVGVGSRMWNWKILKEFPRRAGDAVSVKALAFSRDGQNVVISTNSQAQLYEHEGTWRPKQSSFVGMHNLRSVAFSPDGQSILTGSDIPEKPDSRFGKRHQLILWSISEDAPAWGKSDIGEVVDVAFSSDGKHVLAGSNRKTASVSRGCWTLLVATNGKKIADFKLEKGSRVISVAVRPKNGLQIVTGTYSGSAILWDTSKRKMLHEFKHDGQVNSVAFSPDGRQVLTGSSDHTAVLWDCNTGRKLATLEHSSSVLSVAFGNDGRQVLTGTHQGAVTLWSIFGVLWDTKAK